MYAETFGCMYADFGCMSIKRLGAEHAEVGCKVCGGWVHLYGNFWVHVCGFWVQVYGAIGCQSMHKSVVHTQDPLCIHKRFFCVYTIGVFM